MLHCLIRLYIIDDHFLIIDGFFSSFDLESEEFEVVGGSLTVNEALEKITQETVDVIILDLFINNTNPVSNFLKVHQTFPSIPIVILSHEESQDWQMEMFRHGIRAYINKNDSKEVMKQQLCRVFAGDTVIPDQIAKFLISANNVNHNRHLDASTKEIIDDLATGLTIKEIAHKLNQSDSSIEKKLNRLREYFHAKTNIELVCKVLHQSHFRFSD